MMPEDFFSSKVGSASKLMQPQQLNPPQLQAPVASVGSKRPRSPTAPASTHHLQQQHSSSAVPPGLRHLREASAASAACSTATATRSGELGTGGLGDAAGASGNGGDTDDPALMQMCSGSVLSGVGHLFSTLQQKPQKPQPQHQQSSVAPPSPHHPSVSATSSTSSTFVGGADGSGSSSLGLGGAAAAVAPAAGVPVASAAPTSFVTSTFFPALQSSLVDYD